MGKGELGIGLAVLAWPGTVTSALLAAPVEGISSLVVARMGGIAAAALGLTWWWARKDAAQQLRRIAPGFLGYNLGVGLLFLLHALAGGQALLPWSVAAVHLLAGVAFAAALSRRPGGSRVQ
jgi:hypothetical protein